MRKIVVVNIIMFFVSLNIFGQVPDTSCYNADVFCTLEALENTVWETPDPFEPEFPTVLCSNVSGGNGQPNNPLYFGFVPNSSTVSIQINPIICTPTNGVSPGYQWAIFEGCDLEDPVYIDCDGAQVINTVTITNDNFIPGYTYYLVVDGFEGSICTFTLDVLTGIPSESNLFEVEELTYFSNQEDSYIANGDTIDFCENGSLTTQVHGSDNNIGYVWSSPDPDGSGLIIHATDSDTLEIKFTEADSIYQICSYAFTDCDESEEICFYVNIQTLPDDSLGIFDICAADLALGFTPDGWACEPITGPGTHFCTVEDTLTGCTQLQVVKIIKNDISIETKDTLICGTDTLFYNGDTITGDYFEKDYRFDAASVNGCDSLLKLTVERVRFYATLSTLSCLDNEQFGIEVLIDSIFPNDYESIIVDWFRNDVHYLTGSMNDLQLIITEKGNYSAMVTVFKYGQACVFDLAEVEIDRFITADFNVSEMGICVDDSLTVTLDAYNISASYEWIGVDHITELFPGSYEISWDQPGVYDLALKVDFDGCEVLSDTLEITVEGLLEKPDIQCMNSTNDSIYVEWTPIDCTLGYEIWLNGEYIITTNVPKFDFGNLEQGQNYEIIVNALTECLCPSTADTTYCQTLACPQDISLQCDQLPMLYCADEFTRDTLLTAIANNSSGGTFSWEGDIISSEGLINAALVTPGKHAITIHYDIDGCLYELTDTLTIFPSVEMDVSFEDISCFYNQDGSVTVDPISGTAPFNCMINGVLLSGLDTTGLQAGIYDLIITDVNLCSSSAQFEILRPDQPDLSIIGDTFIERGQTYEYQLTLEDINYDSVVWYVPSLDTILCSGICDEISYAPLFSQDLCIELFYDQNCKIDTCIHLSVNFETKVYIPNVFTPGKRDGMNDYFMIKTNIYDELKLLTFSIFDRWGEMVFHKGNSTISSQTDESFGWDGTLNGQAAVTGVYVYLIEYEDENGELVRVIGDLTLIR